MLSHNIGSKQADKDESPSTGGGGGGSGVRKPLRPPDKTLKCPRCDSPNTKFCYYNNYNLAQPRHFCKACRRYWTKGGALRNVPIGGSCRKNKKTKSCSSRFFIGEPSSKSSSSDIGGMKFYGLSSMDSQLGGLNFPPRFLTANHFSSSYGDTLSNNVNLDPLGFNFPLSSSHIAMKQVDHHQQQKHNPNEGGLASFHEIMGTRNNHLHNNTDLASSIESLSSINQDLHWKLQQQRLATLLGGDGGGGSGGGREDDQQQQKKQDFLEPHNGQKLQPILFQNLEISKPAQSCMDGDSRKDAGGGNGGGLELATEWFFEDSYAPGNVNHATPTNSNSGGNDQSGSINNWNIAGIEDWNNLKQYSEIP